MPGKATISPPGKGPVAEGSEGGGVGSPVGLRLSPGASELSPGPWCQNEVELKNIHQVSEVL